MIEYRPNLCAVVESETSTQGVMYADYFSTVSRICLTRVNVNQTHVLAKASIIFKKQPNFIVKSEKILFRNSFFRKLYHYYYFKFLRFNRQEFI